MSSSERAPVEVIREAAQRAVAARGLRPVARDVDVNAMTLDHFLRRRHTQQESTLDKLNTWYARQALETLEQTKDDVRAGLALLVKGFPENERREAALIVLQALRDFCRKKRRPPPDWLKALLAGEN